MTISVAADSLTALVKRVREERGEENGVGKWCETKAKLGLDLHLDLHLRVIEKEKESVVGRVSLVD